MVKKKRLLIGLIAAVSLLAGCMTRYAMKVDAIKAASELPGKDYVLLPGSEGLAKNDLYFKEFSIYVEKALANNGYRPVARKEDCQLLIYLSYGIGEPRTTLYSGLFDDTPPFVNAAWAPQPLPLVLAADASPPAASPPPVVTVPRVVRPPFFYPRYFESYPNIRVYTSYRRYLILEAVDYRASLRRGEAVPVWKVTVSNWGENYDLREIFPALVAAGTPYIGTDTGKNVEVILKAGDVRIQQLK